jgi:plasmid stabilization system protein ParE
VTPTHTNLISPKAFDEIEEVIDILCSYSGDVARSWYAKLVDHLKSLTWSPERFPLAPEDDWYRTGIRQVVFGKRRSVTRILFRVDGNLVRILRVRYGQRDVLPLGDLEVE